MNFFLCQHRDGSSFCYSLSIPPLPHRDLHSPSHMHTHAPHHHSYSTTFARQGGHTTPLILSCPCASKIQVNNIKTRSNGFQNQCITVIMNWQWTHKLHNTPDYHHLWAGGWENTLLLTLGTKTKEDPHFHTCSLHTVHSAVPISTPSP